MDLATLIIKTQDSKTPEERQKLREQYNCEVRRKNKELFEDFKKQLV